MKALTHVLPQSRDRAAFHSTVRGSVTDSQSALIPVARSYLANTAIRVMRESVTNGSGLYFMFAPA